MIKILQIHSLSPHIYVLTLHMKFIPIHNDFSNQEIKKDDPKFTTKKNIKTITNEKL